MGTRVLVYSHDTFGLGNIRRMLAISEHLLESIQDVSVLLVTGSPMVHGFRVKPGLDYIKLPCLSRTGNDEYSAKSLGTGIDQMMQLRSGLILSAARDFDPDIVLIDKKPDGVKHELRETLQHLRENRPDCRMALVLRDILDSPDTTVAQWKARGYDPVLREYFHSILILGSPDVFDAAREYKFSGQLRGMTQYAGYLRRGSNAAESKALRARMLGRESESGKRIVLVTPGGGEDGFALLQNYAAGLPRLPADAHSVIVCGPEMPAPEREAIARMVEGRPNVSITDFTGEMLALMGAADVIVSMAGYNTICEILSLNKRAVAVPRVRPVAEQWIRATRLAKLGLLEAIHPDYLTPEGLADAVAVQLASAAAKMPLARLSKQDGLGAVSNWVQQNAPRRIVESPIVDSSRMTWNTASLTY